MSRAVVVTIFEGSILESELLGSEGSADVYARGVAAGAGHFAGYPNVYVLPRDEAEMRREQRREQSAAESDLAASVATRLMGVSDPPPPAFRWRLPASVRTEECDAAIAELRRAGVVGRERVLSDGRTLRYVGGPFHSVQVTWLDEAAR